MPGGGGGGTGAGTGLIRVRTVHNTGCSLAGRHISSSPFYYLLQEVVHTESVKHAPCGLVDVSDFI